MIILNLQINLFITVFILINTLILYTYLLAQIRQNLTIDMPIDTNKRLIYRYFITSLLLFMFISIFVWRFIRRNTVIAVNKEYLFSLYLDIREVCEITDFILILLILLLLSSILLWMSFMGILILYIKGIAYTTHTYFYQYTKYSKIMNKLHSKFCQLACIDGRILLLFKEKSKLWKYLHVISVKKRIITRIIFICIVLLPFILLVYDIYMHSIISNFFYSLPWVYLVVLIRLYKQFIYITYTGYIETSVDYRSEYLYKKQRLFDTYKLHCKTYTVINDKKQI